MLTAIQPRPLHMLSSHMTNGDNDLGPLGTSKYFATQNRKIHYCAVGESGPVVVFESGLGKSRTVWGNVQPAIAKLAQTVVYDRAGYGNSDVDERPRIFEHLVQDHIALLEHLGHPQYILVGHSYGGPIIRSVATTRPDLVAGIVLVDESPENVDDLLSPAYNFMTRIFYSGQSALARIGLLAPLVARTYFKNLTGSASVESRSEDGTVKAARTAKRESLEFVNGLRHLRENPPILPQVPTTSISANRKEKDQEPGTLDTLAKSHAAIIKPVADSLHVISKYPGHYLQLDDPEIVIDAICHIVDGTHPACR